ncbi:MAG: zinc metalloprotease [Bizionia sp.]|nr:zinc metalloprotease [Bizionia sp.]
MKKLLFSALALTLLFSSCNEDKSEELQQETNIDMSDFYVYTDADIDESLRMAEGKPVCHTMVNLNRLLNEDRGLEKKMYDIEYQSRSLIAAKGKPGGNGGGPGDGGSGGDDVTPIDDGLGTLNIPVYVHVVYSNSNQNISDNQIGSQIAVLNEDFRLANSDASQLPAEFSNDITDTEIEFTLAGTFRHANSTASWGTNDAVKNAYPPVTPDTHLNIWVCNIGGGILGYAQFPGGPSGTDGVVVGPQYFGTTGYVASPFDGGRTTTHEVGHYLNLRHIWGDGRCNRDDFVVDTPKSDAPNYGCPSYPTYNCKSNDMTMNYMDYVDDACMYMFSDGQRNRMRALFAPGGVREGLAN